MCVSYFIFTSGEEGTSRLDWGVKFVSSEQDKKEWYEWDKKYRKSMDDFGLPPDLRPISEAGLLMLPWPDENMVLTGFIFPYFDIQAKRPNFSLVATLLPCNVYESCTPAEAAKKLWTQNPLEDIAKRPEDRNISKESVRPEFLDFNTGEEKGSNPYPQSWDSQDFTSLNWPREKAILYVNGKVEYFERSQRPATEPIEKGKSVQPHGWMKKYVAWAVGAVLVLGTVSIEYAVGPWLSKTGPHYKPTDEISKPISESKRREVPSEEQKITENILKKVMEKNKGSLNGLIEVYPVTWGDNSSRITKKSDTVWEKRNDNFAMFSSMFSSSESETLLFNKPPYHIKEDIFITKLADLLKREIPNAKYMTDEGKVSFLEVRGLTSSRESIEKIEKGVASFLEAPDASNIAAPDVIDVQKKLAAGLREKGNESDNSHYAFVFEETEGLYKVIIYRYPQYNNIEVRERFRERYYLKSAWASVDREKFTDLLKGKLKVKNKAVIEIKGDNGIDLHYITPFPPNESLDLSALYKEFAMQLLDAARER